MRQALTREIVVEIGMKSTEVWPLAGRGEAIKLDRLRDGTATLQCLIAEAVRLQEAPGRPPQR